MKKVLWILLPLLLLLLIAAGIFLHFILGLINRPLPDTVSIDGTVYQRTFSGELYASRNHNNCVTVSGVDYYLIHGAAFDCYLTDDPYNGFHPAVYFPAAVCDDAVHYYRNPENFLFYCWLGNLADQQHADIYSLDAIDSAMFDRLLQFYLENDSKPFSSSNDVDGQMFVPIPEGSFADGELSFYKESDDGVFTTPRFTLRIVDDRLCLLHHYDFADEDHPQMKVVPLPTDLSDYFLSLVDEVTESSVG